MSRPDGLVDPLDLSEVAAVLAAVRETMGDGGLEQLLCRLPGVQHRPATPRRMFTAAQPATVLLGRERMLRLSDPPELAQEVGGVVLHRSTPARSELPLALAEAVAQLARDESSYDETAVVLSGARDATDRF